MKVLVAGALGFIGRHIVAALRERGHEVVAAVRAERCGELPTGVVPLACDFERDLDPAVWLPRLAGVDAVVNAAGVLKATRERFEAIHAQAPLAIARAAAELRLRRFVQISALGDPGDGEFLASKHRGDAALLGCGLPTTVLRPSLVYAFAGSYGGSSLLRALAAAPWLLPVPGLGRQPIAPLHARDLAALVLAALERPGGDTAVDGVHDVVGPKTMRLVDYLRALRRWLGLRPAALLPMPMPLLRVAGALADRFGDGPSGSTMLRMLMRGNTAPAETHARLAGNFGVTPRSLDQWQSLEPAHTQDRWHARLYPFGPLLRWGLGLMCLLSAAAGFAQTPAQVSVLVAPLGWPEWLAWMLGYGGSAADAVLGAMLLGNWRTRLAGRLLLALVVAYTLVLGFGLPGLWLDPWGALAKNLALLPAILAWRVLDDRR
ncbi:MAG: SDR family oxidoreductase [Xanthomonadales bacterium]|nr:hypothetical protein [Xanthomonadales bacterium]MCC6592726.1 SDR family oxidoreductase [Xanthomonadales bacterium]MCE7931942.1 NAD-dependent epimerase/dehydratase family protein [Xanthomonadales bacterium PRO6]